MEFLDMLHAKLKLARRILANLIDNYGGMGDTERLEKSTAVFDEVYSYLKIHQNLLLPYLQKSGRHADIIERTCTVQNDMDLLLERTTMMHVDEPGGEYYNDLIRLQRLIDQALQVDETYVFPWMRTHLNDDDQYYIATHLKDQMTHESLPSSGYTIY